MADRDEKGRFLTGNNGGPGRNPSSKNKLSENFRTALSVDFEAHGVEAIVKVRTDKPEVYLRIVADLVPKDVTLHVEHFVARVPEVADTSEQWLTENAPTLQ